MLATALPNEVEDLWEALLGFTQEQLMQLLARCAALTVDAVVRTGSGSSPAHKHVEALSQAVSLDMAVHWRPTAASCLGQVTKAVIVEAVREGGLGSCGAASRLEEARDGRSRRAAAGG